MVPALVCDAGAQLGEGPWWDAARGRLLWVDIEGGLLHRFDPASGEDDVYAVGRRVSAAIPRADGALVLVCQGGVHLLDERGGEQELLAPLDADDPSLRTNDATSDAAGRLWIGTMALDARPGAGALYRLDPGGEPQLVLSGATVSNGTGWSPDGATMYYADTPLGRIDAFDFDAAEGTIANRRTFAEVRPPGLPDGLCVDVEGGVWVALWEGGELRRYSADGELSAVVALPVPNVTSCCFGGASLDVLYVTTATGGDPEAPPHAGGLFRVEPGVRGLATTPCAV